MVALVQRPAPTFTAEAVVDGLFETVSLEQYKGKWSVHLISVITKSDHFQRVVLLFYPMCVFTDSFMVAGFLIF